MENNHIAIRGTSPILARDDGCVMCPSNIKLKCPPCKDNESCAFTSTTCHSCAAAVCRANDPADSDNSDSSSSSDSSKGPSAGPIAGGVIGGIIVIAIITYLVWKFLIKPKRGQERQASTYEATSNQSIGHVEKDGSSGHDRRESTYTVHSIASTVLTRASNIIQIAYIPGMSNRGTPTSQTPDVLVPPVPPIPAGRRDGGYDDGPYYGRESTYSGYSGMSDGDSYAGNYNQRASIASTIYGKQAQVQTASQAGMRAKPTVVSVKSGGSSPNTPPVPSINFEKFNNNDRPESLASNFSVGSTFVNTATQGRAQVVKVGGLKKIDIAPKSMTSSVTSPSQSDQTTSPAQPSPIPTITETPPPEDTQGPFADPPTAAKAPLGAIKEDKREDRSSSSSSSMSSGSREKGPFGDEHAAI